MLPELKVFFAAMTPFDLKLAIPLGFKLGMSKTTIFLFATLGTIVPAAIMLAIAEPVMKYLRGKFPKFDKFCDKLFHKTRKEHSKRFERYGALLLFFLTAIPIPGGGPNVAALIAFIFGVEYWRAFFIICIGTATLALLILGGVGSVIALHHHFF